MTDEDWIIYGTYSSKFCSETLQTLKYDMSLPDLMELNEYTQVMESYEEESREQAEQDAKHKKGR